MEYYDNTLCISHAELTDGIMTTDNSTHRKPI